MFVEQDGLLYPITVKDLTEQDKQNIFDRGIGEADRYIEKQKPK